MERLQLFGRDYSCCDTTLNLYGYYTPDGFLVVVPARYPFWEQGYEEEGHWIEYADPVMISDYKEGKGGWPRFMLTRDCPEVDATGWIWPGQLIKGNFQENMDCNA